MVEPAPGTDPISTTAYTVSADAAGTGSGISAADRAATARTLADASTLPATYRAIASLVSDRTTG
jgi:3,4-dihydroxy 2-butanone 4-phosphate synthase/GTP cyclohydrolase II